MQVSGAPGQLRSNSNFRWSQAPSGTPLGQKWGWPHKFVGPDFGKLAPQTGSGAGAKLRSNDTFFGRSQLAPEPAPESAPRLNVPVKCGHDDDVNPVASNLFFFRVQRYPNFQSIHRTFSTRISQMPTIILEKKEPKRSNTSNSQENSLHTAAPSRDCFHSSESPDRSSKPNVTYRHRHTE